MNDLERRLLNKATSDEEREAITKIMEHERRVNHARSIELFLQGLGGVHAALSREVKQCAKNRQLDSMLLVIKMVAAAFLILGAYLVMRAVIQ